MTRLVSIRCLRRPWLLPWGLAFVALGCGGSVDNGDDSPASDGTGGTESGAGRPGTSSAQTGGASSAIGDASPKTGGSAGSSATATGGHSLATAGQAGGGQAGSGGLGQSGGAGEGGAPPQTIDGACALPIDPGPCDDVDKAFGYNTDTGICEGFIYGGCDGNANRFESLQACVDACDPGGLDECTSGADCTARVMGCCGVCEPYPASVFSAINTRYRYVNSCPELIQCEACEEYPGIPEGPYYGATCTAGRCELFDVREIPWGVCESDADCILRNGTSCCEGCAATGPWAAVSTTGQPPDGLCSEDASCAACDSMPPEDRIARCESGHCVVAFADP